MPRSEDPNEWKEFNDSMSRFAISLHSGGKCFGCGKVINTMEELETAVHWPHEEGTLGHKECLDKQVKAGLIKL